jgi:hypothetical protein
MQLLESGIAGTGAARLQVALERLLSARRRLAASGCLLAELRSRSGSWQRACRLLPAPGALLSKLLFIAPPVLSELPRPALLANLTLGSPERLFAELLLLAGSAWASLSGPTLLPDLALRSAERLLAELLALFPASGGARLTRSALLHLFALGTGTAGRTLSELLLLPRLAAGRLLAELPLSRSA